jgi:hypothetical protein
MIEIRRALGRQWPTRPSDRGLDVLEPAKLLAEERHEIGVLAFKGYVVDFEPDLAPRNGFLNDLIDSSALV